MKTVEAMLAVGLAFGVGMTATAQPASGAGAGANAQANAITSRYMTSVQTELTSRLDSRNATVGQEVTAKTTQTAKLADGTTLPKGTKLVGHVTQVRASNKDQPYAVLSMTFDRAELKSGESVALRSVIRTVAPPANVAASAADSMMADEQAGPASAGAGGMGPGSARGGGPALGGGGVAGGTARGGGQTAGGVGQVAGPTIGGGTRETHSLPEATADTAGGAVTQAGETVSTTPRATGLPGVVLATSATADVSGTLMASGRNISLDTGTQITLGVIAR
jgi:hypothetical protein